MNKNKFLLLLLFIISTIINYHKCYSAEIKFEYDKYFSTESGITNIKSIYNMFSIIQNNIENIRLKIFTSTLTSYITLAVGHEVFGHGYPLRKKHQQYNYQLFPPSIYYLKTSDLIVNSQIYIGGLKFNRKYEDLFIKDGIMNNFSYRNSTILFLSEIVYLKTYYNNNKNDINQYINNLKKINQNTKIDKYIKKVIDLSIIDPSFLISSYILSKDILINDSIYLKIDYLPIINFNLYPISTTLELGTCFNINKTQYSKFSYELGYNVWNKRINGFNFEYTNIPIYNEITFDFKFHYLEKCTSNILLTVSFKRIYLKWKFNIINKFDSEPKNKFYIGFNLLKI